MAVKRLYQIAVKRETQAGVLATSLVDAANATLLVRDAEMTPDVTTFERDVNRASFTPLTPVAGIVEGTCSFTVELAGKVGGGVPAWSDLLEACGFEQRSIYRVALSGAIGTATPPAFFTNEAVTSASEADPGVKVIHDTWDGSTNLYVSHTATTTFGGAETITGGTSTATVTTAGTPANEAAGYSWTPVSVPLSTLDVTASAGTINAGQILIGETSGAVIEARESISGAGNYLVRVLSGTITAGETLSADGAGGSPNIDVDTPPELLTILPSVSIALLEDGVIKTMRGCRGSVSLSGALGETVEMRFTFRGIFNAPSDGTIFGAAPSSLVPPTFIGVDMTVGRDTLDSLAEEYAPCISQWSCDFQNELAVTRCAIEATGLQGAAFLTGRTVTGSLDPTVAPEAAFPWVEMFRTGETARMGLTIGSTAGNTFRISQPALFFTGEGSGDRDGIGTRDMSYSASGRAPNGADLEDREFVLSLHTTAFVK